MVSRAGLTENGIVQWPRSPQNGWGVFWHLGPNLNKQPVSASTACPLSSAFWDLPRPSHLSPKRLFGFLFAQGFRTVVHNHVSGAEFSSAVVSSVSPHLPTLRACSSAHSARPRTLIYCFFSVHSPCPSGPTRKFPSLFVTCRSGYSSSHIYQSLKKTYTVDRVD